MRAQQIAKVRSPCRPGPRRRPAWTENSAGTHSQAFPGGSGGRAATRRTGGDAREPEPRGRGCPRTPQRQTSLGPVFPPTRRGFGAGCPQGGDLPRVGGRDAWPAGAGPAARLGGRLSRFTPPSTHQQVGEGGLALWIFGREGVDFCPRIPPFQPAPAALPVGEQGALAREGLSQPLRGWREGAEFWPPRVDG